MFLFIKLFICNDDISFTTKGDGNKKDFKETSKDAFKNENKTTEEPNFFGGVLRF